MNWSHTALTERLDIRYPIIQAPLAGGPGTPQLAAAISNAGGLGSLAGGYPQPEALRQAIAEMRALTDRPFAVNLALGGAVPGDLARLARARELLAPYRAELGLPPESSMPPEPPAFEELLDVVMGERVAAVSFIFGAPDTVYLDLLRDAGIVTFGTATHLLEAIVLEESGVDFVVAQGAEAGGHRGTFIGHPEQGLVGILTLVPLLAKHIRVPIIAGGGIMDGRGIAAARILGAAGIQMGTAFLACPESGASPAYKALLSEGSEIATTLSRVFTGRVGRVLRNRLVNELHSHEADLPGFPLQLFLTEELRQVCRRARSDRFHGLVGRAGLPFEREPASGRVDRGLGGPGGGIAGGRRDAAGTGGGIRRSGSVGGRESPRSGLFHLAALVSPSNRRSLIQSKAGPGSVLRPGAMSA
jgi:nitronate monooxygenase